MPEEEKSSHSSGEYSGVVEDANVAMSGKGKDVAAVISSGKSAQEKRRQNRANKEKESEQKK